ncbi:spermatogenesis-associated protein 22 [Talpa occidentalis]|uniref:spermatogenesis-associated protein 22 n=1 Tax=Talpa occidentalis TaxID=50954 RepID=UPI00188E1185|nr:spermatogenesis-associated protein 22 [Talpa occidentalis]
MKRNLNENSTRSTAGCLPVPLFNQKKRNRQPLTSNPFKNDPGISTVSESYDFPPLPTDWTWEVMSPELPPVMKTVNSRQTPHSVSQPLRSQDSESKSIMILSNTERSKSDWSFRDGNKNTSLKPWDRNDFRPQGKRTNLVANDEINSCPVSLGSQQQKQLRQSEPPNLPYQRETEVLRQKQSSKMSVSTMRGVDKNSTLQAFKPNFQQNQIKKKMLGDIPEENTLKETSSYHLKFKEKDNSLRIISAVIESMKYWHEHAQKAVLLFEILGVLDSAVTPGPNYSKSFLMRDGKNILPCVFYEIDRALPRLIRGQVHRCVGHYDQKKNIFKCVSVRPATISEQKTFQVFVQIGDAEMKYYTNVMNEI